MFSKICYKSSEIITTVIMNSELSLLQILRNFIKTQPSNETVASATTQPFKATKS